MSAKRFKFVSPGVFINEIDNSQLPQDSDRLGPVVVGRTERGPAMRPVTVKSQAEFIEMFGNPIPGGRSGDVWREGNYQSPTYASYAAMAYLRNNSPVTVVRLLGAEHENKADAGRAGWKAGQNAYGLFVWNQGTTTVSVTGTLAAVWYFDEGVVCLSGTAASPSISGEAEGTCAAINTVGAQEFKATIYEDEDAATKLRELTFNFDKNSDKFIRRVFNTNPALMGSPTSSPISSELQRKYFLGQTFEDHIKDYVSGDDLCGVIVKLADEGLKDGGDFRLTDGATAGTTGWVLSQQIGNDRATFDPAANPPVGCERLFKINAMDCGEWESGNLKVTIEDVRYSRNEEDNPFGAFTVAVRKAGDNDASPAYVERFTACNLNPQSPNYIKRKVGDQTLSWQEDEKRYKVVGDYPNNSKFIRIEINSELDSDSPVHPDSMRCLSMRIAQRRRNLRRFAQIICGIWTIRNLQNPARLLNLSWAIPS